MDTITFTDNELYMAMVMPRLNSLLDILTEELSMDADLSIGAGQIPYIIARREDRYFTITYFPTENLDEDRYVLMIRTTIEDEGDPSKVMYDCETFNAGSFFGFAVYLLSEDEMEYRVTIPEEDAIPDGSFYHHVFSLIDTSIKDLLAVIKEEG